MKKRIWTLVMATALSLALFGCGSGGGSKSAAMGMNKITAETAAAAPAMAVDQPGEVAEYDEGAASTSISGGFDGATSSQTYLPEGRKLIRTMNLNVETTSFDQLLDSLRAKVSQLEGYIQQSDISGNSITNYGRPSLKCASLTLRIPVDHLDSFISQVESECNVIYKFENVSDVTLEYSDVESRLKTLRMEQERLWELLAQADSTESILALEQRLTDVSIEIETSESRLRHLDNSVLYSTVYLNINEVDLESPTQPETAWQQIQRGFARNITSLGDALTVFLIRFLSSLPILIFCLLILLILCFILRRIRRKYHRGKAGNTSEKEEKKEKGEN